MAKADYYLCDVCACKTFYDSVLDYQRDDDGSLKNVGDLSVLCPECSSTHRIDIVLRVSSVQPVPEEDWSKVERIEWRNTKYEGWYENGTTTREEDKSGFVSTVRDSDFTRLLAAYTKLKGKSTA